MAKKARKVRSGPRAPAGKAPLQIVVAEKTIEEAKIKAIREKTKVSRVAEELVDGWLDGTYNSGSDTHLLSRLRALSCCRSGVYISKHIQTGEEP